MSTMRNDFPVFAGGLTQAMAANGAPIMLDGMEVLFDKTVGLAPVRLVPRSADKMSPTVKDTHNGA